MLQLDASATASRLGFAELIPALRRAFAQGCEVPLRHTHTIADPAGAGGSVLLMPAWKPGGLFGLKTVMIFPGNSARGLPGLHSLYTLFDASTGEPLAQLDGNQITSRRTAAAAALAASFLAREWRAQGIDARSVTDLAAAAQGADIVSCATLATAPLVRGQWLRPGTHLDLIGSFTPQMRVRRGAAAGHARAAGARRMRGAPRAWRDHPLQGRRQCARRPGRSGTGRRRYASPMSFNPRTIRFWWEDFPAGSVREVGLRRWQVLNQHRDMVMTMEGWGMARRRPQGERA